VNCTVRFHVDTERDFAKWIHGNDVRRGSHPAITEALIDELISELKASEGNPIGAFFVPQLQPPRWVWRFSSDTWISYILRTKRTGLFGSVTLEVIVLSIASEQPA
jgi:hypothetical protein